MWAFRGFIAASVRRDYQLRYRSTVLGFAWNLLQPLTMILIYTLVFSQLMRTRLDGSNSPFAYGIHLCAGIFTWNLFAEIIQRSQTMFLDNANLLKKLRFPRMALPLIVVSTALLNFSIVLLLFLGFLLVSGNFPGIGLWALLPLLVIQILFSMGLGLAMGVLNVFFRDVGQLSGLALQLWFWATPIVYPASILPSWLLPWMQLNPMYHLMRGYQTVFSGTRSLDWASLLLPTVVSLLVCGWALGLFLRHAGDIVDEL
jgi:lipopolysaccharide transport system permease protein